MINPIYKVTDIYVLVCNTFKLNYGIIYTKQLHFRKNWKDMAVISVLGINII